MKRYLLPVVVVLVAAHPVVVFAQVPDPARSSCPAYIVVVGRVSNGAAVDPLGLATITNRDFANNPRPGIPVTLDFSGCCDLALCGAESNGQALDVAGNVVSGVTNGSGQFSFTILGAARDPGTAMPPDQYGGCAAPGVVVRALAEDGTGTMTLCTITAVCLDQNGAAGGSNGTTTGDVANPLNLFGSIGLGAPYKSRGDINADGNITIGDVNSLLRQVGRLGLPGGIGCTSLYGASPGCP